jgi:hypothetical protein
LEPFENDGGGSIDTRLLGGLPLEPLAGKGADAVDRTGALLLSLVDDLFPTFNLVGIAARYRVVTQKTDVLLKVRRRFLFCRASQCAPYCERKANSL